ncbi:MAG: DUF421 domain-containing protein [Burkholderiaceae bacterium]
MEIVLRTIAIYAILFLLFRVLGKRSMSQLSAFDFILFLVISEAIQNALIDDDKSVVMGVTIIMTFLLLDWGMALLKKKSSRFEKIAEGVPVVLVDHGRVLEEHLDKTRITTGDILQVAREKQGLERMKQVKYAVLETAGSISIIPMESSDEAELGRRIDALDRKLDALLERLPCDDGAGR